MGANAIDVREATSSDEVAARDLAGRAFQEWRSLYRPTDAARRRKAGLEAAGMKRLVAFSGGVLVGTVQFRREGDALHVLGLAVDPSMRRKGIGAALIRHLEALAAESACASLSLFTVKETGNAVFFGRVGFAAIEESHDPELEGPSGGPITSVRMAKPVTFGERGFPSA